MAKKQRIYNKVDEYDQFEEKEEFPRYGSPEWWKNLIKEVEQFYEERGY